MVSKCKYSFFLIVISVLSVKSSPYLSTTSSNHTNTLQKQNKQTVTLIEIKCTPNCVCTHFDGFRKATCSAKKMVFVKANIPPKTEILDFSHNYVTKIHNNEFHDGDLAGLKVLNVSNNRIGEIEIFAFETLTELEVLDLSSNALQYILTEWFWPFNKLKEVYLNSNNLGALKDNPLFESQTLQRLSLSNCQLPHFYNSMLSELPSLESLDLSNNFLINIKTTVVSSLKNLIEIKLQNNNIICEDIHDFLNYLEDNNIHHETDCLEDVVDVENLEANLKKSHNKFEKMINWSDEDYSDKSEETLNPETSWTLEDIITNKGVEERDCPLIKKDWLVEIVAIHPIIVSLLLVVVITVTFLLGLFCGCLCNKWTRRRKRVKTMDLVSRCRLRFDNGQIHDREFLI